MNHLEQFPQTQVAIDTYVNEFKSQILSGNEDPLNALKQLKFAEKTIAKLLKDKDLDAHFVEEAQKYGKSFTHLDTNFTVQEVGTKYDYSTCCDSVYNDLASQKAKIDEEIKLRETFLKSIPLDGVANPSTGEMIYPPLKTSSTKVVVKL